ncbi:unnamed protein product [Dimorphilus gyrociliatus]|uniref:G-protein coupled receptors family 2 profile 2 domain-containing protein n=1 Tax=Dimorphilus gyrociliatus TaxID=2664684 RepID=A0A7I8VSP5_9ANNE|nr:unnamed protein product [Dimorphilus gyrociliatus]
MECKYYNDSADSLLVISRCSNGDSCEFGNGSLLDHIPMIHNSSSLLFKNIRCALCNGFHNVKPIDYTIHLKGNWDNIKSPSIGFRDLEKLIKTYHINYSVELNFSSKLETCFPNLISTCPKTCTNQELIKKCQSIHTIANWEAYYYKNAYCLLCNIPMPHEILPTTCNLPPQSKFNVYLNTFKYNFLFSDLLNLGKDENSINSKTAECTKDQIYVESEKKCLNVVSREEILPMIDVDVCNVEIFLHIVDNVLCRSMTPEVFQQIANSTIEGFVEKMNMLKIAKNPLMPSDICQLKNSLYRQCEYKCRMIVVKGSGSECQANKLALEFHTFPKVNRYVSRNHPPLPNGRVIANFVPLSPIVLYNLKRDQLCKTYIEFNSTSPLVSLAHKVVHFNNYSYICKEEVANLTLNLKDERKKEVISEAIDIFGLVCTSLSLLALLFRLIAPAILPALRTRGLWFQWNLVFALLIWQWCIFLSPFLYEYLWVCRILAVFGHLSILSSIGWQAVLATDIFFKCREQSLLSNNIFTRAKVSTVFATVWSVSSVPVIISIMIDTANLKNYGKALYGSDSSDSIETMADGNQCWIYGFTGQFMLLFLPFAIVLLFNIIILALSIRNLHVLTLKSPSSKKTNSKREIIIYGKLTILFGATWIFMILASFIKHEVILVLNIVSNACIGIWIGLAALSRKKYWQGMFKRQSDTSKTNPSNTANR